MMQPTLGKGRTERPHGHPFSPYVEQINENEVVFRNYAGERYVYKQPALPGGSRSQARSESPQRVSAAGFFVLARERARRRAHAASR
jgi:hypothetical protein